MTAWQAGPADTVLHADNYGHGPAYTGSRCDHCAAIADRAVIARIGGNVVRRNPRLHDPSTIEAFARADLRARYRRDTAAPMLPEAAFDWPVYRAALTADDRRIETLESFADSNRDDYATHVRGWFDADTVRAVLPSGEWGTVDG